MPDPRPILRPEIARGTRSPAGRWRWAIAGAAAAGLLLACGDDAGDGGAEATGGAETGPASTSVGPGALETETSTAAGSTSADGTTTGPNGTADSGSGDTTSGRATEGDSSGTTVGAVECISEEIQAGLDAAAAGDTVTVCNGLYVLDLPLSLPAGVTLAGESTKGVVLQQLSALGNGADGSVIRIIDADGARVTAMTLRGPDDSDQYAAIFVENSDAVTIDDVEVYDFARAGLGYGVAAIGTVDALLVEDSYFEHNRHGVTCQASGGITNNVYRNNTFVNHTDAAIDNHANSTGTQVLDNTIVQGEDSDTGADGIILQGLVDFVIEGNSVDMGPADAGRHGILIQYVAAEATQTTVTGTIADNTLTNVGNTTNGNSESGVVILGDDPSIETHAIVLSGNSASGAGMANALVWDSPGGLLTDPSDVPDTTLSYP
ncbi:MAG: right-handed parallel beta-helix repeat-containing protein [Myxococcota bacterium]